MKVDMMRSFNKNVLLVVFFLLSLIFNLFQVVLAKEDGYFKYNIKNQSLEVREGDESLVLSLIGYKNGSEKIIGEAEIVDDYLIKNIPENDFLERYDYLKSSFNYVVFDIRSDSSIFDEESFHYNLSSLDSGKMKIESYLESVFGIRENSLSRYRTRKEVTFVKDSLQTYLDLSAISVSADYREVKNKFPLSIEQNLTVTNNTDQDLNLTFIFKNGIKAEKVIWENNEYLISEKPRKFASPDAVTFYTKDGNFYSLFDYSEIPDFFLPELWVLKENSQSVLILSLSINLSAYESESFASKYSFNSVVNQKRLKLVEKGVYWDKFYDSIVGTNRLMTYANPINYQDRNGIWHPIDTSIKDLDLVEDGSKEGVLYKDYSYGVLENNFKTYFNSKEGYLNDFSFENNKGYWLKNEFLGVEDYDSASGSFDFIDQKESRDRTFFRKNTFTFDDVLELEESKKNRVEYEVGPENIMEKYVIENKNSLPTILGWGEKSGIENRYLGLVSKFYFSDDLKIKIRYLSGYEEWWDKYSGRRVNISNIKFYSPDGEYQFGFEDALAFDSNNEAIGVSYVLDWNGTNYIVRKVTPYWWLMDKERIYPVVIDPTLTVYGSVDDGFVSKTATSWPGCRGASSGDGAVTSSTAFSSAISSDYDYRTGEYTIRRSFFKFDTSMLPDDAEINSATMSVMGYIGGETYVNAFIGTWGPNLDAGDYDAFGNMVGTSTAAWDANKGANYLPIDEYLDDVISTTSYSYFVLRENYYDVLGNVPNASNDGINGCYFSEQSGTSSDPYLIIDYTGNALPQVGAVTFNAGEDIVLVENATTTVVATATFTDEDGYKNVGAITGKVYRSGVGSSCEANDNNCYIVSCNCASGSGNSCLITCIFVIWFHADPTDATSSMSAQWWEAYINAQDQGGADDESTASQDVNTLRALDISVETIDYGTMNPGDNSGLLNSTTTLTNMGNDSIDIYLYGVDMESSESSISIVQQEYSTSTGISYGSGANATSSADFALELDLTKPTSHSSNTSTDDIYWGLGVPSVQAAGTYTGTTSFVAKGD